MTGAQLAYVPTGHGTEIDTPCHEGHAPATVGSRSSANPNKQQGFNRIVPVSGARCGDHAHFECCSSAAAGGRGLQRRGASAGQRAARPGNQPTLKQEDVRSDAWKALENRGEMSKGQLDSPYQAV
jgi:hypothetical protein